MQARSILLLLICISIATIGGNTQQLHMSYYTVNEGLLSNTIRKIFQDSKGNMWISTVEGLSKYDGHHFTNYTKANGLSDNLVNDMLEIDGTLVFACNDGGLAWMQNDKITKLSHPGAVINRFYRMKTGKVMVATDAEGIQEFKDGQLHKPSQPFPNGYYFSLAEINDSLLLAGSDHFVQILTKELKLIKSFGRGSTYYGVNVVLNDSRGRLWASHLPGPSQLSLEGTIDTSELNIPEFKRGDVQQIFEDKAGNVWFASVNGLVQLSPEGKLRTIRKKNGLLSDVVVCISQDKEDNLWVGTNLGLCKFSGTSTFTSFDEADGLAYPVINFLFSDQPNQLITVTIKGRQVFDEKNGKFSPLIRANILPYVSQKQLAIQRPLHTGTGQLLSKNTKVGRELENFFSEKHPLSHIWRMSEGRNCFFMSADSRFFIYDGNKVSEDTSLGFSQRSSTITSLAMDKDSALWIGTWEEGLFRIEYIMEKGQFRITNKKLVLSGIPIRSMAVDKQGNVWAGTRNNGLYRLTQAPDGHYKTKIWNIETGLTSNWVQNLYQDEKGNIWVMYEGGLDKLINRNDSFRVFNFSRVNNFFANVYQILPAANRSFWLGTANGLVHMNDGEMENKSPWQVNVTAINVGDSSYNPATMPLSLSYKRNSLKIDFSASTYINEKQVLYSYRLVGGGHTAWSRPENLHSVSFASLRPGKYRFEVRTLGWNEQWGDAAAIQWTILPPVWQRDWFIVLCFLLFTALITVLVRARINFIKREIEMKQQLSETEMMALRAQMNPHFLFNSLNAIDNLIQTHQQDKASTYLGRFARLLRLVLDSSKNKLVPFDRDFNAMQLYLDMEKFRSTDKFQFEIAAEPELLNGGYSIPPLLAQPFIENAIHHGLMNKRDGDRRLSIKASVQDDFIIITIADNGVGRIKAKELNTLNRPEHTSYGWQITAQRLGLHNGGNGEDYIIVRDLYEENEASGTSVTLKIKINPS